MIIILTNYLNLVTIYHVSGDSVQKLASDAFDASNAFAADAFEASAAKIAKTNAFAADADAAADAASV